MLHSMVTSKSAVCCWSATRTLSRRAESDPPPPSHHHLHQPKCFVFANVNPLCFFSVSTPHCTTLPCKAASKYAVCCCSAAQTRKRRTTSDLINPAPHHTHSGDGLHCMTLLAMAALTPAVCCCNAARTPVLRPSSDCTPRCFVSLFLKTNTLFVIVDSLLFSQSTHRAASVCLARPRSHLPPSCRV